MFFMSASVLQAVFSEDIHHQKQNLQEQDLQKYTRELFVASIVYVRLPSEKEKALQDKWDTLRKERLDAGVHTASPSEIMRITQRVTEECILGGLTRQRQAVVSFADAVRSEISKTHNIYWNRSVVEDSVAEVLKKFPHYLEEISKKAAQEEEVCVDQAFINEVCQEVEARYKVSTMGMFFGFLGAAQKDTYAFCKSQLEWMRTPKA